ncbi:MAG: SpoIID/LytB domain-containing protein [Bacteroidetes bacterium]|nr:MAG: SpoIID/LytB domain-containing protein [Bacteroidota bacterium]
MRLLISGILFFCVFQVFSQEIQIGLFYGVKLNTATATVGHGTYVLKVDSLFQDTLTKGAEINFSSAGGESVATVSGKRYVGKEIHLIHLEDYDFFTLKGTSPVTKLHSYHGDLLFKVIKGKFQPINRVDMDQYLAGVIESEGGGGKHLEYYKVQALMSRSYAFKNLSRHKKEGYQLCDAVHCQAYHNRARHELSIIDAVHATRGEVIVDDRGEIITTYFYANCGGQTSDASYVWNNDVSYCTPFLDTFCIHTRQAKWEKRIPRAKWEKFIRDEYGIDIVSRNLMNYAYQFKQDQRKAFYIHPSLGIPLRDLRSEFGLKSTFFDVTLEGEEVVLRGKGFGHGVGLCQEGAMQMAKNGYHYSQIALFYFTGVHLKRFGASDEDIR